jgi:hypothetical protein
MIFPKRILTKEIAKWYDEQNLPTVRLEENGKRHGVQPPQVHEAMVEIYHEIQEEENTKPTRIAWRVWERARGIQARHHEIASQIIERLREENRALKRKIASVVVLGSIGTVALVYGLLLVLEHMGVLIK